MAVEAMYLMNTFRFFFNLCYESGIRLLITVLAVIPANISTDLLLWFTGVFNTRYSSSASILLVFFAMQGCAGRKGINAIRNTDET